LFSFAPCPPAQITVEQVQYPFAEEELKLDLGNLFTIRSPFNERNTKACYFSSIYLFEIWVLSLPHETGPNLNLFKVWP